MKKYTFYKVTRGRIHPASLPAETIALNTLGSHNFSRIKAFLFFFLCQLFS